MSRVSASFARVASGDCAQEFDSGMCHFVAQGYLGVSMHLLKYEEAVPAISLRYIAGRLQALSRETPKGIGGRPLSGIAEIIRPALLLKRLLRYSLTLAVEQALDKRRKPDAPLPPS